MHKLLYLLSVSCFVLSIPVRAALPGVSELGGEVSNAAEAVESQAADVSEEVSSQAGEVSETVAASGKNVLDVAESELIELLGYITAQNAGIARFDLDQNSIESIVKGIRDVLEGKKTLQDIPENAIRDALGQFQTREESLVIDSGHSSEHTHDNDQGTGVQLLAGSGTVPEISNDALEIFGTFLANQFGIVQLGFGAGDASSIAKGFVAGASATEPDTALEAKFPAFQQFIQERINIAEAAAAAEAGKFSAERIAAGAEFIQNLVAEDPEIKKSLSGLYYKVVEPGSDPKPTLDDSVLVHYKGTLIDGRQFDSSIDRGQPAEFPLKGVVKGFGEGLTKIGKGGKIILYIPSELGYGNNPRPGGLIQPGDTLIFECELIEINP